jgi:hypothetical protein
MGDRVSRLHALVSVVEGGLVRLRLSEEDTAGKPPPLATDHPFQTEPGDHAETPLEAYEHIAPLLHRLARRLDKTPGSLRIYDPYYCEGGMLTHMHALGFESVYNRPEDFYAKQATGSCPEYDVLCTNPPFSGRSSGLHLC